MKIFDTKDIRDIDAFTIQNEPVSAADLMERAASGCAEWISCALSRDIPVSVFTGPGNNGGDGWALARLLVNKGFGRISLFHLDISNKLSPEFEINRQRLISQNAVPVKYLNGSGDFPVLQPSGLIIDALFGSGLTRQLEGLALMLVNHINKSGCRVISIDIPSGLFGEDNAGNTDQGIIRATDTLTFQFPKRAFFFPENEKYVGRWHIIPIGLHPEIIREKPTGFYFTDADFVRSGLRKRRIFSHKGMQGHALLIAGSYGMMGAAILAARACLRTGAGLLTTHVPHAGYPVIQASVPESIFSIDRNENTFSEVPGLSKFTAIGAGPGLGQTQETATAVESLLKKSSKPLLLDADALNLIAQRHLLELLPEKTVITPHPGEFDRLAGSSESGYQRNMVQIEFSKQYRIIIVLKGAYSSVSLPDGSCYFNSTGNPGMATAGSGDVLTGMILSLLAQGYAPEQAALTGTFIHGMAGDIAASLRSEQALIASDIIENIGNAFNKIHSNEDSDL